MVPSRSPFGPIREGYKAQTRRQRVLIVKRDDSSSSSRGRWDSHASHLVDNTVGSRAVVWPTNSKIGAKDDNAVSHTTDGGGNRLTTDSNDSSAPCW